MSKKFPVIHFGLQQHFAKPRLQHFGQVVSCKENFHKHFSYLCAPPLKFWSSFDENRRYMLSDQNY